MRRSDLDQPHHHVVAGAYVIDGEPGDPNGIVIAGPFRPTPGDPDGQRSALAYAGPLMARTGRVLTITTVADVPA